MSNRCLCVWTCVCVRACVCVCKSCTQGMHSWIVFFSFCKMNKQWQWTKIKNKSANKFIFLQLRKIVKSYCIHKVYNYHEKSKETLLFFFLFFFCFNQVVIWAMLIRRGILSKDVTNCTVVKNIHTKILNWINHSK